MNFTIDAGLSSILTALVVGIFGLLSNLLSNRNSQKNQSLQIEKDKIDLEKEKYRIDQEIIATKKKENLITIQEMYSNSIASLSSLLTFINNSYLQKNEDYTKAIIQSQKSLSYIVAYYYDKNSEDYSKFVDLVKVTMTSLLDFQVISLRNMVIDFASKDPRINTY